MNFTPKSYSISPEESTANLFAYLPDALQRIWQKIPAYWREHTEEIRLRQQRPLEIRKSAAATFIDISGQPTLDKHNAYLPTELDLQQLLERASNHSLYAYEEELRRGYLTLPGGHRIGLSGRTVLNDGKVKLMRDIAGLNIRIAQDHPLTDSRLLQLLYASPRCFHHTLIFSPPQQGKTTLVRSFARAISSGYWDAAKSILPMNVGIVDERSEIAACISGVPSFDVGPRTDVLDACPKAEGMMMMIRSMSPHVLIVDEIGRPEDALAIREALHAGVAVLSTAHAKDWDDLCQRPTLQAMVADGVFQRYVSLQRRDQFLRWRAFDRTGRLLGSS